MLTKDEVAVVNGDLGTIRLGNKQLLVAQPRRSDLFSFWKYCRKLTKDQFNLKDKLAEIPEDLPEDVRGPLINALILEYKMEPTSSMVWETMSSPAGVAFLTFLLTREHNKIELNEIEKVINNHNVNDILIQLEDECGMRVITENLRTDPLLKTTK